MEAAKNEEWEPIWASLSLSCCCDSQKQEEQPAWEAVGGEVPEQEAEVRNDSATGGNQPGDLQSIFTTFNLQMATGGFTAP